MMSHYSNGTTTGNMTVHGFLLALHVWIYGCFNIILCGPAGVGRCYVMGEGKGEGKGGGHTSISGQYCLWVHLYSELVRACI